MPGPIDSASVTILGLGSMGGALAKALLRGGVKLTVWNRTPARAHALAHDGAVVASSVFEAVQLSDLTIICMIDKAASEAALLGADIPGLSGRTIVDLSTGDAEVALRIASYVEGRHGFYLNGGIMCYPKDIGKPKTVILYAGKRDAFIAHENTLSILAGSQKYLGENPRTAVLAYLALYAFYFGALASYFEGAALARAGNVDPGQFKDLSAIMVDMLTDGIATATDRIVRSDYFGDQASVDVHVSGQEIVRDACATHGTPHAATDAFLSYCKLAQDAGDGEKDIASIFLPMTPGGR
ncbi:NAD(P)-binding domain-containing protein [Nguyenibacter sp. L1]|uniref:NAD(P)-dependent oxidoreductase n=1 Tax=Nguyenibacter sp. L1 TaxID=3049350 RepID=UPI002B48FA14|nr:NAD(P)-binding domain-containing protein [Nguyenibacter sp. L1]WRH89796.1 NAD(P)-binding domain-containing protein [Nguyenibacter sp. L1]